MNDKAPFIVRELNELLSLCEEGRRELWRAARSADDMVTRLIYRYAGRCCEQCVQELEEKLTLYGGQRPAPAPSREDEKVPEKLSLVRCLNWQSAAIQRYALALRCILPSDVSVLLKYQQIRLQEILHQITNQMEESPWVMN